jgi:hypothetical protein
MKTYAAEHAPEQVIPADVEGRGETPGLAADPHDRGQQQGPDRKRHERRRHASGRLAEPGIDRRLQGDR